MVGAAFAIGICRDAAEVPDSFARKSFSAWRWRRVWLQETTGTASGVPLVATRVFLTQQRIDT
jgi:hypothetical protein